MVFIESVNRMCFKKLVTVTSHSLTDVFHAYIMYIPSSQAHRSKWFVGYWQFLQVCQQFFGQSQETVLSLVYCPL